MHDGHPGKVVFRRALRRRARAWPRHHRAVGVLARGHGQRVAGGADAAVEPIDVVLDGYHLSGKAMETRIEPTVRDLAERIRPRVVAPGHCAGWRAKAALAQTFAPARHGPSVVGSLYTLRAS